MKPRQKFKKLLLGLGLASSAIAFSTASLAQSSFFFPSASFFSPAAAFYQSEDEPSVEQVLETSPQYESFYAQLEASGLLESMTQDSITILVPTNEAFAALDPSIKSKLSQPENLTKLLQYHLVAGIIDEQDIKRQAVATLLDKSSVQITGIPLAGNKVGVKINQSIAGDPIRADNGVIIPINEVLIPPGF
ncbi:secreted/surface protein with fasciclin-like repeats [Xenococcus sp. PCC 7305]|uniref:fasciclin domain-containing protein n=1 Tax=Xenococcus sp. PCC 7305 TaxID=102125 RepID=UPI0002ABD551|nr:fasciclin domain-containing protein [Xenococcus sp. PCC 7305]ELS01985.1 secreted/surface protein with fasciclin-like repeats [Xenococcus sp. PCC 7305]